MLDRSYCKQLDKKLVKNRDKEKVMGLDQKEHEVIAATIGSSKITGQILNDMKFLFLDLGGLSIQFEDKFDGLLGFPFFQQHTVSINYQEQKIYIWN